MENDDVSMMIVFRQWGRLLIAVGHYRKWLCAKGILCNFPHWAWYMGHTSGKSVRSGGRNLTAVGYYRKWSCFKRIHCNFHHWAWYMGHTSGKSVRSGVHFMTAVGYYRNWSCFNRIHSRSLHGLYIATNLFNIALQALNFLNIFVQW